MFRIEEVGYCMFTGIVEEIGTVVSVQSRERSAIIEIEVSKTGQGTDVEIA